MHVVAAVGTERRSWLVMPKRKGLRPGARGTVEWQKLRIKHKMNARLEEMRIDAQVEATLKELDGGDDSGLKQGEGSEGIREALSIRLHLRRHPDVRRELQEWWEVVQRSYLSKADANLEGRVFQSSSDEGPAADAPTIELSAIELSKAQYMSFMRLAAKVLVPPKEWDPDEYEEELHKDWESDAGAGRSSMSRETFMDGLFELCDLWAMGATAVQYCEFLSELLDHITTVERPRTLLTEDEVVFCEQYADDAESAEAEPKEARPDDADIEAHEAKEAGDDVDPIREESPNDDDAEFDTEGDKGDGESDAVADNFPAGVMAVAKVGGKQRRRRHTREEEEARTPLPQPSPPLPPPLQKPQSPEQDSSPLVSPLVPPAPPGTPPSSSQPSDSEPVTSRASQQTGRLKTHSTSLTKVGRQDKRGQQRPEDNRGGNELEVKEREPTDGMDPKMLALLFKELGTLLTALLQLLVLTAQWLSTANDGAGKDGLFSAVPFDPVVPPFVMWAIEELTGGSDTSLQSSWSRATEGPLRWLGHTAPRAPGNYRQRLQYLCALVGNRTRIILLAARPEFNKRWRAASNDVELGAAQQVQSLLLGQPCTRAQRDSNSSARRCLISLNTRTPSLLRAQTHRISFWANWRRAGSWFSKAESQMGRQRDISNLCAPLARCAREFRSFSRANVCNSSERCKPRRVGMTWRRPSTQEIPMMHLPPMYLWPMH